MNSIGFEWMLVGIACLGFMYAPLLTFLRAPPTREEKKVGDDVPNGNVVAAITNGESDEKKGAFNLAMTLDNGDLALPQTPSTNGNRTATAASTTEHVTKL